MYQGLQRHVSNYMKKEIKVVPIAPAPKHNYMDFDGDQRRYSNKSNPYTGAQAASIARRNARERNRVKQVNDGFNALRKRLPSTVIAALSGGARRGSGTKLSKVDTLRMVVEYIRHLQGLIEESDAAMGVKRIDSRTAVDTSLCYEDEGIFGGSSPYSDSPPSPVNSECSSGVSVNSSNANYMKHYQMQSQVNAIDEEELLDTISWWQHT